MSVSLVLAAHAKLERLRLTMAAIEGLNNRNDIELVVVADGAEPRVIEYLSALKQDTLRLVQSPGLGRAGARNLGAKAAAGDLLVFIDDDVLFGPTFVRAHLNAHGHHEGLVHGQLREMVGLYRVVDPALGGPSCPPVSEHDLLKGNWSPGKTRLMANALEQAAEHPQAHQRWPWLAAAGANISVPRSIWAAVGGFDESYGKRWGVEDIDFAFRIWSKGFGVTLDRHACGFHMSHDRGDRWEEQNENLLCFQRLAQCPEAQALGELLGPTGTLARYSARVDQIRQDACEPVLRT